MAMGAGRSLGEVIRIEELPLPEAPGAKQVRIVTRSGTNSPQFTPPQRVDTPVEPNQIEFRALVTLRVGIR
jgi:hypothetical protein